MKTFCSNIMFDVLKCHFHVKTSLIGIVRLAFLELRKQMASSFVLRLLSKFYLKQRVSEMHTLSIILLDSAKCIRFPSTSLVITAKEVRKRKISCH